MRPDPFGALYPPGLDAMRVAWDRLPMPGPPRAYALTRAEVEDPNPRRRFARRTIQEIDCGGDCLALIDKAAPHSLFDLMVSETSDSPKATPDAVRPATGRVLWRSGLAFVRFVCDPRVGRRYGLSDGELHLALNCDPHTRDRESVQAAKQFHLHLLYWPARLLRRLHPTEGFAAMRDPRQRRQAVDPLAFLGPRLIFDLLDGFDLGIPGARLAVPDERSALRGLGPLGCSIDLPGWDVLDDPGFEDLVRRLHRRLAAGAADLLEAFTGQRRPPPPWYRHPLLPLPDILQGLAALPLSVPSRAGLRCLAEVLDDLPEVAARRLARTGASRRMHHMTLNQPCYALNLRAPGRAETKQTPLVARRVDLIIQLKLFSGIGGAGLLHLRDVPIVRVRRGEGRWGAATWSRRARFQREFAEFNQVRQGADAGVVFRSLNRFVNPAIGWRSES